MECIGLFLNLKQINIKSKLKILKYWKRYKTNPKKSPVIVSVKHWYFTTVGHIIVIDSIKDDKFLINNPNFIKNSKIEWPYQDIQDQIVKLWLIYK